MTKADEEQTAATETDDSAVDEGEVLEWTTHPVKKRPVVALLVSLFIALVVVVVYYSTGTLLFALLGLVVLVASVARFYFPTTYRLSDCGVAVKTVTQTIKKDWLVYRSCYPDKNGILLSPFVQPSRLENFRGIYLIFEDNRDEVVEFVRKRIEPAKENSTESGVEK
ncbi:MAG: hypothetical protein JSU65_13910 [Candidatus Zixiibacteriota bacterium]|nr:MAG: hypothetical protein JSU65_13910 [candidate division Zixibacteria bacterium]